MTADERETLAVDYALGLQDRDQRKATEERANGDPVLRDRIESWENRLADLAGGLDPVDPPSALWANVATRIAATRSPDGTRTTRCHEGPWHPFDEGTDMKVLARDPEMRRQTIMLRIRPGATYGGHSHDHDEELVILTGDLAFGDFELGPGDHHYAPAGSAHPAAISHTGCTAILIGAY